MGKAAYGLSQLVKSAPEVFAGEKILFLHSGKSIPRLDGIGLKLWAQTLSIGESYFKFNFNHAGCAVCELLTYCSLLPLQNQPLA